MNDTLAREIPDHVRIMIVELCKETESRDYVSFRMEDLADSILRHFGVKQNETT